MNPGAVPRLRRRNRHGKIWFYYDYGCRVAPNSINEGFRWLARGMRNVSRHSWQQERALGIDKMVMIYPRNDMVPK